MTRRFVGLVILWNWKSAVVSSICRSLIFLAANLAAGPDAALRAMAVEFAFRAAAAGFFGAMTQAFTGVKPARLADAGALVLVPLLAHIAEFLVHTTAGTPALGVSMAGSIAFSMVTTMFNLHAMRQGALIVGEGSRPLIDDLRRAPALAASFVAAVITVLRGGAR